MADDIIDAFDTKIASLMAVAAYSAFKGYEKALEYGAVEWAQGVVFADDARISMMMMYFCSSAGAILLLLWIRSLHN